MTGAFIINSNQWKNTKKRKTFPSNFHQFYYRKIRGQLDIASQV